MTAEFDFISLYGNGIKYLKYGRKCAKHVNVYIKSLVGIFAHYRHY